MDTNIAVWLNQVAQQGGIRQLAEAGARFLFVVPLLIAAYLAVRSILRRDAEALGSLAVAGVGTAIALAANVAATSWWYRARPYTALHDVHALVSPNPETSFFSDHTVAVTRCALAALLVSRRWGVAAGVAAVAVAVARVAVGAHYPTDVLAAALVTAIAVVAVLPARRALAGLARKILGWFPASRDREASTAVRA